MSAFLTNEPEYERAALVSEGMDGTGTRQALQWLAQELASTPPDKLNAKRLRRITGSCAEQPGADLPALERTLRVAITGSAEPSDVYAAMALLGKERALQRIERAVRELMVVA